MFTSFWVSTDYQRVSGNSLPCTGAVQRRRANGRPSDDRAGPQRQPDLQGVKLKFRTNKLRRFPP
jgi:hypothetical protein